MLGRFYREQALGYLLMSIPDGKRPRQPFALTKQLLDQTLSKNARLMFSLEATRALGSINAMYWFAEYLEQRHFISDELGAGARRWCEELWSIAIDTFGQPMIEAGAFRRFPPSTTSRS